MNGNERLRAILTKQPADRMGYADKIWVNAEKAWQEQGYLTRQNPETGEKETLSFIEWFDQDMDEQWNIRTEPILGFREVISETDEWIITKNGAGAVFKNWKDKDGTPEHIAFEMDTMEVWQTKYKPYLQEFDPARCDFDGALAAMEKAHRNGKFEAWGNLFIWELLRSSLGDVGMFEALLDEPEWIMDFNRTYTSFFKLYYQKLIETCGKPDGVWLYDDFAYNKGPFCSPDILRELFLPFYQEMTSFFHSYDIPVILHSCGNVESLLPLFVEFGVDALNPMEVKAGCDVVRFAEKYGEKLSYIGGLDVRLLEEGNRCKIRKEIERITSAMRKLKVGYAFGTDHSVTPNVDFEIYKYAVDVFRDNMYY